MEKPRIFILGHSHIDAEWLWTREETLRVCHNTFENVLKLMDKYPELTFVQSSACYYLWMEDRYPEVFEKILRRVREGKWEPVAPWVEFDANIPSGESIVRQLVYSKEYFREKLNVDVRVLWLPDTFGFPITLPQIMKEAGIDYFLTQKLNWNDSTAFPYNYFWWESPDGTRVLAHQTLGGYGGIIEERRLKFMLRVSRLRQGFEAALIMIGFGDHGGGLSEDMVESARSLISEGRYDARFTTSMMFFKWLEKLSEKVELPVWRDELYLQYHRGTYTTQARYKRLHRLAEQHLLSAERLASVASWYGYRYPSEELRKLWLKLLFNQFHDILAGSSIPAVYDNAERDMREVVGRAKEIMIDAASHIASLISADKGTRVAFNTLPWPRKAVVELEEHKPMLVDLPALGYTVIKEIREPHEGVHIRRNEEGYVIENEYFKAVIDSSTGALTGLYIGGENLIDGSRGGVRVQVYKDEPTQGRLTLAGVFDASMFDAWEIYIFQQPEGVVKEDLLRPQIVEIVERGPIKATVRVVYTYRQRGRDDSRFEIRYEVCKGIPWITMRFKVDWHAKHRFAKLYIPLSYYSEYAIYDQAYGWVKRRNPLSPNATLAERAKWEVPGHMWVDVSRPDGTGIAVLDDGKYGYDFGGDFIRVSLLRSARYPDPWGKKWKGEPPITDQGVHEFSIGLLPHRSIAILDIAKAAYEFNNQPLVVKQPQDGAGELPSTHSFLEVRGGLGVVLKRADKGEGYIVRLHETNGDETKVRIITSKEVKRALLVNFLEEGERQIPIANNSLTLNVKPFKIITVKLELGDHEPRP